MRKVHGHDSFQRINYLYQISKYMADRNIALSSYYGNLIINVGKKNVLKIHPDIKRQVCKKCRCILIDKITAKVQLQTKRKRKFMQWKCNTCATKKMFPVDQSREHRMWLESPEAVVEVVS